MGLLANVFGFWEDSPLFNLDEDLEGTLCCIAFAGKTHLNYIRGRVNSLEKKYDSLVEGVGVDTHIGLKSGSEGLLAIGCVCDAYRDFVSEDWREISVEERANSAEDILGEHHFLGSGIDIHSTLETYRIEWENC